MQNNKIFSFFSPYYIHSNIKSFLGKTFKTVYISMFLNKNLISLFFQIKY